MNRLILEELKNNDSNIIFHYLAYHFLYSFFDDRFILKDEDIDLLEELKIPHTIINTIKEDLNNKEYYRLIYFFLEIKRSDIYNLFYDEDILWGSDYISYDYLFNFTDLQVYDISVAEDIINSIIDKTFKDDYYLNASGSLNCLIKYIKDICIKKEDFYERRQKQE